MSNRHQLANPIQSLEGDQVKAIVLEWLEETEGSLDEFEQLLEADRVVVDADAALYGELDEHRTFQPLSDVEMAAQSLQVLEEYKRTRQGVPHERVQAWLDSLSLFHHISQRKLVSAHPLSGQSFFRGGALQNCIGGRVGKAGASRKTGMNPISLILRTAIGEGNGFVVKKPGDRHFKHHF